MSQFEKISIFVPILNSMLFYSFNANSIIIIIVLVASLILSIADGWFFVKAAKAKRKFKATVFIISSFVALIPILNVALLVIQGC